MWLLDAILGLAAGFALGWVVIWRGRRPLELESTTSLAWIEQPVPFWHQDPVQALFIGGHTTSVLLLAVLFALDLARGTPAVGPALGRHLALMAVWFMAGSLLAFPLAYRYAGKMPMSVFVNGVARGQYASDWGPFSHFRADASTRVIRLYSVRTPEVVRVAWQPPTAELFDAVVQVLAAGLPDQAPVLSVPWYRRRAAVLGALAGVTLPFLLGGVGVYAAQVPWSWIYYTAAVSLVMLLGQGVVKGFQLD
jgi:hypothetical protein